MVCQSVLCVVIVVMLATAAIGIYGEGLTRKATDPLSWIYTREKAVTALKPVLPLLLLSLVMTAVGLIAGIRDQNGEKPVRDTQCLRDLTVKRAAGTNAEMRAEQSRQKRLFYGGWIVFALCMIPVLLYLAKGEHFPNGDLEPVFLSLVGHVLPWVAIGFSALSISTVLQEKSMQREIEAAKEQIKKENASGTGGEEKKTAVSNGWIRWLR